MALLLRCSKVIAVHKGTRVHAERIALWQFVPSGASRRWNNHLAIGAHFFSVDFVCSQ